MIWPSDWDFVSRWAWPLLALLLPAAWGLFWLQRKRAAAFTFGNTMALRQVESDVLGKLWWLPGLLRLACIGLLVVALARPQKPNRTVVTTEGVDVVVALDLSASMNAVDMTRSEIDAHQAAGHEPPNRFEVARELLIDFVKNRAENGDRVGLIIFGYGAYLKFPLTTDYARIIEDIKSLKLDDGRRQSEDLEGCLNDCTISGAQTNIGDALKRAFLRLRDSQAKDRSIILITDGADKGSKMAPRYVAEYIRDWSHEVDPQTKEPHRPIPVYTFLIGGSEDTYMPEIHPLTNQYARNLNGLLHYRPAAGQFEIDPKILVDIAQMTGGQSYQGYDEKAFREQFKALEKSIYKRTVTNFPEERFMPLATWAFGLLLCELFLRLTIWRKFP